jgi:orotate phosphoribosyltransferase
VDDLLRSGRNLREMQELLESRGARVVALAVIVYQPTPRTRDFGGLPLYYLAKLNASYYADAAHCDLCKQGAPVQKVWV